MRSGHGLFEALAGDAVDAGIWRGGDDLVVALAQNGDGLRADQAGAADYDDLHSEPPRMSGAAPRAVRAGRTILHGVEPGRARRREMQGEARVSGKPGQDVRCLVGTA